MREPIIVVRGLSAGYAGRPVVRELDLEIAPGEVVALLGPNGAGKTTTLRAVSGLIERLAGTIEFNGEAVDSLRPHQRARRGLAHVPEDRALFSDLTVDENLRLGLRTTRSRRRAAIDGIFDLLPELAARRRLRAGVLSGGEQQMLAVGRALGADPRCLLVDEMSLGLAPIIVQRLLPIVRRIADDAGVGVLMVEQHVPVALAVADRAYALARGRIVLHRPAAELLEQPALLRSSYLGAE
jgi:branched-chain amino acid transport system ATP-binding protein